MRSSWVCTGSIWPAKRSSARSRSPRSILRRVPKATKKTTRARVAATDGVAAACGLCGSRGAVTRTDCCGNLICDDAEEHVTSSHARKSCYRNHSHQTICAFHHTEGHDGVWKLCSRCRESFEPEMYAWYATNEFNFDKLENPPAFAPTVCQRCGKRIVLPQGGFTMAEGKYWCEACDPATARRSPRSRTRRRNGV